MSGFLDFFRSFDGYGEPVQVTYKGDSTYKTYIGALVTLGMQGFMLMFTLTGVLSLLNYENPQITQYIIYDGRSDNKTVSMDESHGEIIFGFLSVPTNRFIPIDPTIATLQVQSVTMDWANPTKLEVHKDLTLASVNKEDNPDLFSNGSALNAYDTKGLYTIADQTEVSYRNSVTTFNNRFLRIAVHLCQ